MRRAIRNLSLAIVPVAAASLFVLGQEPPPAAPTPAAPAPSVAPEPTPSAADLALPLPTPIAPTALRIRDIPSITVEKLPTDNPYGKAAETPAGLPQKLAFADATMQAALFVSVHVDASGTPISVRRDRDPIASLAAETLKSISRWTFAPARKGGQPMDTWGAYRVELEVEFRPPKIAQMTLTPVTASMPIPKPFDWKSDAEWLDGRHIPPPADGSVPIDQVDTTPIPQKEPWSADSFKGPFSVRYWVLVDKSGRITRAIPLDVTDPVTLPYFRRFMGTWILRPGSTAGAPVDSWNELTL